MNTPKLADLVLSVLTAFESKFGTINRGLRSTFRTIAIVVSGQLRLLYLYAARIQKNVFPDLADSELQGGTLERFGRAKLGRNPFPASAGVYTLKVTGVAGGVIRAGVIYKSIPGYNYTVEAAVTLTGATGVIQVRALTPGLDARLLPGDKLNATEPILDVNQAAFVDQEITAPLNAEDIEAYRDKVLQSYRLESQGGAAGDYRIWVADAQGVRQVYPYLKAPGEINIFIEATRADSTDGEGTPGATILNNVKAVTELDPDTTKDLYERGRLPLGVVPYYLPITTIPVSVTITGYTGNISEAQTLLAEAFREFFYGVRPYIPGADAADTSTISAQRLVGIAADTIPADANFTDLQMIINAVPVTIRQFLNGDIPIVGTITVQA